MAIAIDAYRASIGIFVNRVRDNSLIFPPRLFKNNHNFSFGRKEWSNLITCEKTYNHKIKARGILQSSIAISLLINILVLMCGDIQPNPGPNLFRRDFNICHANVRSICNEEKFNQVKCELGQTYDIITLSETWLSDKQKISEYKIEGYQKPFRRDRKVGTKGYGGAIAYVSNNISCKRREDLENEAIEGMWLEITVVNQKVFIFVLYRAESNTDLNFWTLLQDITDNIRSMHNPNIMIIGDLNADPSTRHGKLLNEFCDVNFFMQHVTEPTRITENSEKILDQIITNFPSLIKEIKIESPLATSDHCLIFAKCIFKTKKKPSYIRRMWNFSQANFALYREKLSEVNWDKCFESNDIDAICESFTQQLLSVADETVPNRMVTVRPSDKPWYTTAHRKLLRKKNRMFQIYKCSKNMENWEKFTTSRKMYQEEIKLAKQNFEEKQLRNLADEGIKNSKKWWTLLKQVNNNNKISDSIPPIENGTSFVVDDKLKADLFNKFFLEASYINEEGATLPDHQNILHMENELHNIQVTQDDVFDQMQILKINKAYGPDSIPPVFIKEGGVVMKNILCRIFNISLEQGKFPTLWKKANVTPLYKKDSASTVSNYRPISLLSVTSKVFERIVFKYIFNYFKENFIINNYQSGFQSGRSTVTQLLELYHQFCMAVDAQKEIRVIFLDIKKAFDKVWHKGILHKLALCGIKGNLLNWFMSYLSNRSQRVIINGQYSDWELLKAGVPQGSVLGPLLFLIYINDITSSIKHTNIRYLQMIPAYSSK